MPGRVFERKKRRMPCNVTFEGRQHSGLVVDVSPAGLFIQTNAKVKPGDQLDLKLSLPGETHKLPLQVEVVRKIVVPPRLLMVAHGGVGVRILNAPEAYYNFM
jgi:Tfp pilus assembly protein PilZ